MKLPELKKKFNNKYVIRIIAGVLTIAMVGTGVSVYSAHSENPEQSVENVQLAAKDEADVNLADMLKDNISVSEKEIGKDETVYLISDATGNVTKTIVSDHLVNKDKATTLKDKSTLKDIENVKGDEEFTQSGDDVTWQADGSDIYYQGTSTEKTPVSMKVSYKLDGKDVTPEELAGKSGKVTIRYDYTNNSKFTETVNGEEVSVCVPFAAITGMVLDDSFTNVEVTNGKVQTSGNNNIVIGYALPGLKDSLDLKDSDLSGDVNVPEYFEVTADVENFSLETAMTVVANAGNFLSTDGSSDLSSVDDMINTLTDASSQLQNGSAELASGLDTLQGSLKEFSDGMNTLAGGLKTYTDGTASLSDGANKVKAGVDLLASKAGDLTNGANTLNAGAAAINAGIQKLDQNVQPLTDAEKSTYKAAAESQTSQLLDNPAYADNKTNINATAKATLNANDDLTGAIKISLQEQVAAAIGESNIAPLMTDPFNLTRNAAVAYLYNSDPTGQIKPGVKAALQLDQEVPTYALLEAAVVNSKINDMATVVTNQIVAATIKASGEAAVSAIDQTKDTIKEAIETKQANGQSLVTGAEALAAGTDALAKQVPTLTAGISELKAGTDALAAGAGKIVANNDTLTSGATKLVNGTSQVVEGVNKLDTGSHTLADGMVEFNETGINKLVNAYTGDLKPLASRLQAVLDAGEDYQSYTDVAEGVNGSVKFVYKLGAIKAEDAE